MKTNTTNQTAGTRAQEQSEQGFKAQGAEFAKYIVIRWNGKEQAVSFPFNAKHADVLRYVRQECGDVEAVSAGFYCQEPDAFWCGGESESLNLKSRPEDRQLLQAFLSSPDRRLWDLNIMAQEAEATAELAGANH